MEDGAKRRILTLSGVRDGVEGDGVGGREEPDLHEESRDRSQEEGCSETTKCSGTPEGPEPNADCDRDKMFECGCCSLIAVYYRQVSIRSY